VNLHLTSLSGVLIVAPRVFADSRGFFLETYQADRFREAGIPDVWVQDNLSFSTQNVLRGLHYQIENPQAKLVQAITGEIFDVVVDLRAGSPTFGKWEGVRLSGENHLQLYVPRGFAHGFCVLSGAAHVQYKCSDFYQPHDEGGILWADPDIGILWPVSEPIVSPKDQALPRLRDCPPSRLPQPIG